MYAWELLYWYIPHRTGTQFGCYNSLSDWDAHPRIIQNHRIIIDERDVSIWDLISVHVTTEHLTGTIWNSKNLAFYFLYVGNVQSTQKMQLYHVVPSVNQTWLAGKPPIYFDDVPIKPSLALHLRFFSIFSPSLSLSLPPSPSPRG